MSRRLVLVLGLSWALAVGTAAQDAPPAARWVPDAAVLSIELAQPTAVLDLLHDEALQGFVTGLPLWQSWAETSGYQEFQGIVTFLEGSLGTDWRTAVTQLAGGGITLAVGPDEGVFLVAEATDADLLERIHGVFLNIARSEAAKEGQADRVASRMHGDVEVWSFNADEAHAIVGSRFLFANRPEILNAALDLRAGAEGGSLAARETYRAAMNAAGPEAIVRSFVDVGVLKDAPDLAAALQQDRINPMVALLFAGMVEALRDATWLSAAVHAEEDGGLVLRAVVDGTADDPDGTAAFALPTKPGEGPRPNLEVPGRIAAISLHRDLHRFYAAKDELFPERTSGLIFFENMMGIFFSGRDLTDEVLAATRPDIRLVVAEQTFDPARGTPEVEYPAFAVVLGLRDSAAFGEVLEEGWQKALGLINFTRGQEALPGLIIDRETHADTEYTVAYFSTAGVEDKTKLHERHNFRPTLAMPGNFMVLSSTEGLARDLIDALGVEAAAGATSLPAHHSVVEIDGVGLHTILEENRESLIRSNMIDEGNTREQAETEIGLLLTVARLVRAVDLTLGTDRGLTEARLALQLALPQPAPRTGQH